MAHIQAGGIMAKKKKKADTNMVKNLVDMCGIPNREKKYLKSVDQGLARILEAWAPPARTGPCAFSVCKYHPA